MRTWLCLIILALSAVCVGSIYTGETIATQSSSDGASEITVQPVSQERASHLWLDDAPDPAGVLAAWAQAEDIELSARFSVASIKVLRLGAHQQSGIIAFINRNCTGDPVDVFVVWPRDNGYLCQTLRTDGGVGEDDCRDFNGDGHDDIVVRSCLPGRVAANSFHWRDVYSWNGSGFTKADKDFVNTYYLRDYMLEVNEHLQRAADLLKASDVNLNKEGMACLADCNEAVDRIWALMQPPVSESNPSQAK